ncbi:hypothetical protein Ddye_024246 [Dipteronia dyeriana]|uniref:DUF1985 domain-containing protein n=1 Tax=Dipteronia dyeriana TaxID=168575 RepID=A0AAD9WTZ7_9ROSI|nr:hypothetical protein Ddye_024246 [Dipteronia dyeriana]
MAKRWKGCLKTKECDFYEAKVTCHSHWRTIEMIRNRLSPQQLKTFEEMCFGHFLRVHNLQFSGQLCHHLLLREVDIKGASTHEMWFLIGSDLIRFSKVEFGLVTGLKFGKNKESFHQISKRLGERIRLTHFNGAKKIFVENLEAYYIGYVSKDEKDDEILKLALLLFLEVTLLGKDKRTQIDYFCMQLVDDLYAFDEFPWGSFIFARSIHSLSNCCKGRADRFKERREKNPKHKEERYNIYGFIFAFQVWAFEAIFSLMAKKHAVRVSKDIPRILSWEASTTPNYEDLRKEIFARKTVIINVPTLRFLNPTDEERQQPYFTDLLDEDVPLPAELEPDDPYETAYETDAAGEDNDGGDDGEATQTDETAEVGDGGDVEAQETTLVVRKAPHKIRQQSCFATTATSYASDSFVKKVDELSSEIKILRSEMITKQEISSQLKSFQDKMMLEIQSQFASFKDLITHTSSIKEQDVEAAHTEDDQGIKEGECTVRDHPVEIGSDAGSHDPDASVVQLDKQPKGMIKTPRNRKRSADTSSPFTDSTIRKQKK